MDGSTQWALMNIKLGEEMTINGHQVMKNFDGSFTVDGKQVEESNLALVLVKKPTTL